MLLILLCCSLATPARNACSTEPTIPLKSGRSLRQELNRPVNIFRSQVSLREMAAQLTELYGVPILIDRRVDPDEPRDVQLSQVTLKEALERLAHTFDADAKFLGSVLLIAPAKELDRIRTLVAQQQRLLSDATENRSFSRQLLRSRSFAWDNLTTPAEILSRISQEFGIEIEHHDRLPHDLWAHGTLVDVNALEALAMVAGQFDLGFTLDSQTNTVTLIPMAERICIERDYSLPAEKIENFGAEIKEAAHEADITQTADGFRIAATVGEHEHIESLLNPSRDASAASPPDLGPLTNRTFTLTAQRYPAAAILRTLEAQGVTVEYDAEALRDAGVDLGMKIPLSLTNASANEFFRALCDPLGLEFELEGRTVRLKPKQQSDSAEPAR